jgi:NAD(P)H-nitrite reductase large subunit
MGAESFKPPIVNSDLHGVFTVREYGDADAIRNHTTAGTRHAAVIGGGLLGLEAARHLQSPGVEDVTIVEIFPRLLPKQLDENGSMLLRRIVEGPKCKVILGAKVTEFIGENRVRGIRLEDGREMPAETVLISSGISPRTRLAREAGLEVNKGVVVDERLQTSDPDIFAAGDLAEFQGIVWGIIPAAVDHAPVVAANLLGRGPVAYRQTIPQNTLKVAGVSLTSIGKVLIEKREAESYQVVERLDERRMRYEKYVLREGILEGCILLGSRDNYGFAVQGVGKAVTAEQIKALPW